MRFAGGSSVARARGNPRHTTRNRRSALSQTSDAQRRHATRDRGHGETDAERHRRRLDHRLTVAAQSKAEASFLSNRTWQVETKP